VGSTKNRRVASSPAVVRGGGELGGPRKKGFGRGFGP